MADEIEGEKLPYPAKQSEMKQQPDSDLSNYKPAGKLKDKVALITGADSGIGRAVAIAFAMEGARIAIVYNENDDDAAETKRLCEAKGGKCLVIKSDVRYRQMCFDAADRAGITKKVHPLCFAIRSLLFYWKKECRSNRFRNSWDIQKSKRHKSMPNLQPK